MMLPQAMAAYRTAARLFPGLHLPVLGMGMEYSAMNNLQVGGLHLSMCCRSLSVGWVGLVGVRSLCNTPGVLAVPVASMELCLPQPSFQRRAATSTQRPSRPSPYCPSLRHPTAAGGAHAAGLA